MLYNPKVSIVIPVYNGANYLKKAIDSALAQTYSNCEVLVINDGSIDNGATRELALTYGDNIRYFEKENGGVSTALNFGIEKMQGEYFSWLSHDDEYHENKIQRQIETINKQKLGDMVLFSDFELINENSNVLEIVKCYNAKVSTVEAVAFGLINGCTMLIPKKCFEVVGNFNVELPTTQDYDMWVRLMRKYQIRHVPEVLVRSRHHEQQQSRTDNLHKNECENFYINFIKGLTINDGYSKETDEVFFIKLIAFLRKMQYFGALEYVKTNHIRDSWINKVKILYYYYVNTNWGNRIGLFSLVLDPRRFMTKLCRKRV